MTTQIQVGDRVYIRDEAGNAFYSRNKGKQATVTRVENIRIDVKMDDGSTDYGRKDGVDVLKPKDEQGFTSNAGNVTGKLPAPRGTFMDILYNDGTIILDLPIGTGETKQSVNFPNRNYSASTFTFHGTGNATIKGYRFPSERPVEAGRRIKREDVKGGMKVKLISDNGGHRHWGFKIGGVYNCIDGAIQASEDVYHRGTNYGNWIWEVVTDTRTIQAKDMVAGMKVKLIGDNGRHRHWGFVIGGVYTTTDKGVLNDRGESTGTHNWGDWIWELVAEASPLDTELAAMRKELDAIKAEKQAAEAEVTAARAKVNAVEAKRVALVGRLAKHGIQFIPQ